MISRINSLAKVDHRLIGALRAVRDGNWSYIRGSSSHSQILSGMAEELGHPAVWGDPDYLPPYGGSSADRVWQQLGVTSRPGVGGFPCDIVHAGIGSRWGLGNGCAANAGIRFALAFLEAILLYLPVRSLFRGGFNILLTPIHRSTSFQFCSLGQNHCCGCIVSSYRRLLMRSVVLRFSPRLYHCAGMVCVLLARLY